MESGHLRVKFGGGRNEPVVISKPNKGTQSVILSVEDDEDGIEMSNL